MAVTPKFFSATAACDGLPRWSKFPFPIHLNGLFTTEAVIVLDVTVAAAELMDEFGDLDVETTVLRNIHQGRGCP